MLFAIRRGDARRIAVSRFRRTADEPGPFRFSDRSGGFAEAEAVQDAAVAAYGGRRRGYKIGATNAGVQHLLGCREPFFGPLFAEDMLESGATFRMVPGLLGIECEFAFVLKRACPAEAVSLESLRDAI